MNDWVAAGIALGSAIIVGTLAARLIRSALEGPTRPDALRDSAGPIASLAFSVSLIVGLIVALKFVSPASVADLDRQLVDYAPKVMSAAVVMIMGNVAGTFLSTILDRSLGHVSASMRRRVVPVARWSVLGAAGLIAASQIGIDTTILTLLAAALFFGTAASASLVVGLGSRQVSAEVAAGRALRRIVSAGDRLTVGDIEGTISAIHAVSIEVETSSGERRTVPNSMLLGTTLGIERSPG